MKSAADFRKIAMEADMPGVKFNIDISDGVNLSLEYAGQTIYTTNKAVFDEDANLQI